MLIVCPLVLLVPLSVILLAPPEVRNVIVWLTLLRLLVAVTVALEVPIVKETLVPEVELSVPEPLVLDQVGAE